MSDRKSIELDFCFEFGENVCPESEVRELESYTAKQELIIEDLKKINDDSVCYLQAISIEETKNEKLKKQRDIAVELLDRVVRQGGIHTITCMDIVDFLATIKQIGEK